MPFKKGEVANPNGRHPLAIEKIKWDLIDTYISSATKKAFSIIDGTDKDILSVDTAEKRLDIQLKAMGHLFKLAPQRHVDKDGENLPIPIIGFAYIKPNEQSKNYVQQNIEETERIRSLTGQS